MTKICAKGLHQYIPGKSCPECRKENVRLWYITNNERHKRVNKAWRKANKESISARNKTRYESDTGYRNAITRKRYAAKAQRSPAWMTAVHHQQIQAFYLEAVALTNRLGVSMEVDHIVPMRGKSVSGLHVPWNLQILTRSENSKKGNRWA